MRCVLQVQAAVRCPPFAPGGDGRAALIRRVNQLFHELAQSSFDTEHRHRHRVEQRFWQAVARHVFGDAKPRRSRGLQPARLPKLGGCRVCDRKAARAEARGSLMNQHTLNAYGGLVVVDLGCGTGFVSALLGCRLGPADRLVAIDLSEAALKTTARRWADRVGVAADGPGPCLEQVAGDGQTLALADESVDLLAMNASLHHVPDPKATLHQIDRVLKPGGWFALGFEPNRTHFACRPMVALSLGLERAAWYASPRQNCRRLWRWLAGTKVADERRERPPECDLATRLNTTLLREGLVAEPLPASALLDLVDPHARGAAAIPGFDPMALLRETMADYHVHQLFSSDYLGETARRWVVVRDMADAVFRAFLPRHGSLFCWLIRKPGARSWR